jgi:hypothetical protein
VDAFEEAGFEPMLTLHVEVDFVVNFQGGWKATHEICGFHPFPQDGLLPCVEIVLSMW